MAKLLNRLVIEITNTDKVDELGNPVIGFESEDYAECIIKELEKIICELRNCYTSMPIFNKRKWREENKAYLDCESIIFNHISELKGENNGRLDSKF